MSRTIRFLSSEINTVSIISFHNGIECTGSTSSLYWARYSLYSCSSTKYAQPWLRSGSALSLEIFLCFKRKFASMPRKSAYNQLWEQSSAPGDMKNEGQCVAYRLSSGASCQPRERFLPGCGQAGHSTAHSPGFVTLAPTGSWPRAERLRSFR